MDLRAALVLARALAAEHGLHDWSVTLDRAKARAGACRFAHRQISLSAPLTRLHTDAEVRDTILHEIAHALVGPRHGHDEVWRATAVRIGCSGERCVSPDAPRVEGAGSGPALPATPGTGTAGHSAPSPARCAARCSTSVTCWSGPTTGVRCACRPSTTRRWPHCAPAPRRPQQPGRGPRPATRACHSWRRRPGAPTTSGSRARCLAPGKYYGVVGQVVKRGRTRYHLRIPAGVLTVPFALVEAA